MQDGSENMRGYSTLLMLVSIVKARHTAVQPPCCEILYRMGHRYLCNEHMTPTHPSHVLCLLQKLTTWVVGVVKWSA